ncbi:MAG: hypothetical protein Q8K72_14505 [Acidimicrobiales bacterium]|nr:hypothetical protein [Acidimicrobiales bacterium]
MGAPSTTSRTSGIPRQGPVQLRPSRRATLEAFAAGVALATAVLLALIVRPDLLSLAIAMLVMGTVLLLVIPPVRLLLGARASAPARYR